MSNGAPDTDDIPAQRVDKWLWHARFAKTRALAGKLVSGGGVRLTRGGASARIEKSGALVRPGDQLAFLLGDRLRVVRVLAIGERRGPAAEAAALYEDLSPPTARGGAGRVGARPTKADRRALERLQQQE